jgi:hypothetical protein
MILTLPVRSAPSQALRSAAHLGQFTPLFPPHGVRCSYQVHRRNHSGEARHNETHQYSKGPTGHQWEVEKENHMTKPVDKPVDKPKDREWPPTQFYATRAALANLFPGLNRPTTTTTRKESPDAKKE